jgi:hypothetical protein
MELWSFGQTRLASGQPNKSIDSISVQLNSPSQSPSEAVMSPATGPVIHHHQFSHPAAIFNQFVVSLVDHSLLKLYQDGDVGTRPPSRQSSSQEPQRRRCNWKSK